MYPLWSGFRGLIPVEISAIFPVTPMCEVPFNNLAKYWNYCLRPKYISKPM